MKHEDFKKKAQEMFDGQFPNSIRMNKARPMMMDAPEHEIRDELKEWVDVTIDKYKELLEEQNQ